MTKSEALYLLGEFLARLTFVGIVLFCISSAGLAIAAVVCGTVSFWGWVFSIDSFFTLFTRVCSL